VGAVLSILVISVPPSWLCTSTQVAVDDVLPYMSAIKQNEPALYERIEAMVIRDQDDGLSADRVRANAKARVASYVADKSLFLPDDLTYELSAATRDALAYLADRESWDACARLALGGQVGDIDAQLSPELVERNANNTVRVILAKRQEDPQSMPAEEFTQFASTAFAEASQVTGISPDEIPTLIAGGGDAPKTCELFKSYFDAVLAYPVSVAAAYLRTAAMPPGRAN